MAIIAMVLSTVTPSTVKIRLLCGMLVAWQDRGDRHGGRSAADRHRSTGQQREAPPAPEYACPEEVRRDGQDHARYDERDKPRPEPKQQLDADPGAEQRHPDAQDVPRGRVDPFNAAALLGKEVKREAERPPAPAPEFAEHPRDLLNDNDCVVGLAGFEPATKI